ncbi:MAG: M28 family peptidase [Pirellulales bacterium]|nr:M28 family peptidase [Pirellulales bacterium]
MTVRNHRQPTLSARQQRWFLATTLVVGVCAIGYLLLFLDRGNNGNAAAAAPGPRLDQIPFDGARAYGYLKQICALGRRPSGSEGMAAQRKLLKEHFEKLGATVEPQSFTAPDPLTGGPVPMANLIVHWKPERPDRILLCAHYDTLPFPMLDRYNPRGLFVGANDGASGVALLMELGNEMAQLECRYGIDFVFFDGEEYIFRETDRFFLGSEYFARAYRANPPADYRYRCAVLLDMIGDADLQIFQERNSVWWRDSRPLVLGIWATAARLGVREFIPRPKHQVNDDHLALHDIAGIPACDVIDFDYPAWHTQADTPERCSPLSLAKVGWVVREWLRTAQ